MSPSQQQQQQQLVNAVSKVTQIQEELVEQEIEKYDSICSSSSNTNNNHSSGSITNTDPVLQEWRQKRMLEYQKRQQELMQCRQTYGHGEYMELGHGTNQNTIDMAQEFFQICKASARVIIHCYRPTTELCHTFHTHLQSLSRKHIETRFIKFNVQDYGEEDTTTTTRRGATDNTAMKFLIEKLQIRVMPTLILIQNQQIVHRMEGCTELNPTTTQFSTNMLAYVLGHKYHMIYPTPEEISDPVPSTSVSQHSTTKHYKSQYLTGSKGVATRYRYNHNDDEDDDYEDF